MVIEGYNYNLLSKLLSRARHGSCVRSGLPICGGRAPLQAKVQSDKPGDRSSHATPVLPAVNNRTRSTATPPQATRPLLMMIVYPRETPPHIRTARAQPSAAHRRRHSRPHHRRHGEHSPTARQPHSRRIYRRGFTDFSREEIFALDSLPLWGNSKLYLRVKSLPWVSPKSLFGLFLDSTERPPPPLRGGAPPCSRIPLRGRAG